MKTNDAVKPNAWALMPFLFFAVFYVGLSVWAGDFYKVPMPLAFLFASAVALVFGKRRLHERIETYAQGMGEINIMIMCLIFILAGSFASVAKGCGAVDAAVAIAQSLVPAKLMLAGVFVISCLISLAIGTSCGTIAAVTPIALGFAEPLGLGPAMLVGSVIGGSMFGDNLSMISDTTIAATRTQGIGMREKFFSNVWIALPAAVACIVIYACFGAPKDGGAAIQSVAVTWRQWVLILPYVLILALALVGLNVMALLFSGTVLASVIGMSLGKLDFWGTFDLVGKGTLGMSETLIVAVLAGGMFRTVLVNGGIRWLTDRISALVRGPRTCELGVFLLVATINLFTANNTVAIVIAGPIARECADRFGANPVRIASVLDIASCVVQGLIPYGAQILIAVGIAKTAQAQFSTAELVLSLYYPLLLALAAFIAMGLKVKRLKG